MRFSGQSGDVWGVAAENSPGVIARERVLEMGRNRKRFQGFIGKLLGKKPGEALAELLA